MVSVFSDRSARVLIAEESGSGRQLLSDVVRSSGFTDVTVVSSGRDVLDFLEVESVDWLILPMMVGQKVNAIQVLKLILENSELRHIKTSLIYAEPEERWLPAAFSHGLMSCHKKTLLRDDLQKEIKRLLAIMQENGWKPTLTAAEYLRATLANKNEWDHLIALETNLLDLYPGAPSLLLKLGEAQLLKGERDKGISTLSQAAIIDEKAKETAVEIMEKILKSRSFQTNTSTNLNALGIKTCVVVDPDSAVLGTVTTWLESVGVEKIESFDDGKNAWQWLEANPEPCLILKEWRIPKVTGPILLQRIRHHGFFNVPILSMSSVIKPDEVHLLREMGVDNVIPKPFSRQVFFKNLVWTLQQHRCPTEQKALERKIRRHLEISEFAEAERLRQIYLADARVPTGAKRQIDAEFHFHKGKYRKARDLAIEALKLSGDSLMLLNLIGKSLLKLGDYAAAVKFFEKVSNLSPLNIEHLCNLAVSHFEMGATKESEAVIKRAKLLDVDNPMASELECQHAIISNKVDTAKNIMEQLKSVKKIVGFMNNRAVALTKSGRYDDGIQLYQQTKAALPASQVDIQETVAYNLGLAYVRYGELEKAKEHLTAIVTKYDHNNPLHRKAVSLIKKLDQALIHGTPIYLSPYEALDEGEDFVNAKEEKSKVAMMHAVLEDHKGDSCLKGIFFHGLEDPEVKSLTKEIPHFRERDMINRKATFKQLHSANG